jgi:hypothetical protein
MKGSQISNENELSTTAVNPKLKDSDNKAFNLLYFKYTYISDTCIKAGALNNGAISKVRKDW